MKRGVLIATIVGGSLVVGGSLIAGSNILTPAAPPNYQVAESLQSSRAQQGLQTVTLRVNNMTCASCPFIVRRSLERVSGVVKADVSFREKTAIVSYDPSKCDTAALTAATAGHGFPSRVIR